MKLRAFTLLPALALFACGGGDEEEEATPPGPVCTYFSALRPQGNAVHELANVTCLDPPVDVQPEEVVVTIGCDRRLGVDIADARNNWSFRQPEVCGGAAQCGYFVVELDPEGLAPPASCIPYSQPDTVSEDGEPVPPDFTGLPDPAVYTCAESATSSAVLDLRRIALLEGPHRLRATLMTAARVPFAGSGDPALPPSLRGGPIDLPVFFELESCAEPNGETE